MLVPSSAVWTHITHYNSLSMTRHMLYRPTAGSCLEASAQMGRPKGRQGAHRQLLLATPQAIPLCSPEAQHWHAASSDQPYRVSAATD